MRNAKAGIASLLLQEQKLLETRFVAPYAGGRIRLKVNGLLYTFKVRQPASAGWGLFRAVNPYLAERTADAPPTLVEAYLEALPNLRARLIYRLDGTTWLGLPLGGRGREPIVVRLVEEGAPFSLCRAAWDGTRAWYRDLDPRDDPRLTERMLALLARRERDQLRLKGLTPEDRLTFELAHAALHGRPRVPDSRHPEDRLARALEQGGGRLENAMDRGGFWTVTWTDGHGTTHTSAIAKDDLTVVSSGICLSGLDRQFDLTSLVGVVEGA